VLFWFVDTVWVPARWVLGFFILVENVLPLLYGSENGVAYGAHVGGFVAGLGLAAVVQRWPRFDVSRVRSEPLATPLDAFRRAARAEAWERALREYSLMSAAERAALESGELFALADHLAESAAFDAALTVLRRWVAQNPNHPALAAAHLRLGLIQLH